MTFPQKLSFKSRLLILIRLTDAKQVFEQICLAFSDPHPSTKANTCVYIHVICILSWIYILEPRIAGAGGFNAEGKDITHVPGKIWISCTYELNHVARKENPKP